LAKSVECFRFVKILDLKIDEVDSQDKSVGLFYINFWKVENFPKVEPDAIKFIGRYLVMSVK
jgi:hypothetical protein